MKAGDTKMIRQVIPLPVRMAFTAGDIANQLAEVESQLRHALTKMPRAYGQFFTVALNELVEAKERLTSLAARGADVEVVYEGPPRNKESDAREQD